MKACTGLAAGLLAAAGFLFSFQAAAGDFARVRAAPGMTVEIPADWHVCSAEVLQGINDAAGSNSYNGMAFEYYLAATDRPVDEDFSSMVMLYVNPFVMSRGEAESFIARGETAYFEGSVKQAMLSVTSADTMECRYLDGFAFPVVKTVYTNEAGGVSQRFTGCIFWTGGRSWMLSLGTAPESAGADALFDRIWKSLRQE